MIDLVRLHFRDLAIGAKFTFPGAPTIWIKTAPTRAKPEFSEKPAIWIAGDSVVLPL